MHRMATISASSRSAFGRRAASYDLHAALQRDMAGWLAEWLPAGSAAHQRCLELGAGTGALTQHLSHVFSHFEASDLESTMLSKLQQKVPGVTTSIRNVVDPLAPNETWDWMVSSSLMQWIEHPRDVLKNWHRHLNPSGRVLAGLFIDPSLRELRSLLPTSLQVIHWRSETQWVRLFEQAGFQVERAESRIDQRLYPAALELFRSLHGLGAVKPRSLSPATLRKLLRDYDQQFSVDDCVTGTWSFLRLEARRIDSFWI